MPKEPNPQPREKMIMDPTDKDVLHFGETPKPTNIRKLRVLPPRPPKKS